MKHQIPYKDTSRFSNLILDYLKQDEKLKLFVNHFPRIENFKDQILEKQEHEINRDVLFEALKKQNSNTVLSKNSEKNIDLLKEDTTFTVTTGHQLCLFTGPLYFIYKIISTINLSEQLKVKYSDNNFVPIFWMASEDHDFHEVNHIFLFGKKIEWNRKQDGAVGRMNLDGFEKIINKLKLVLGNSENANRLVTLFEKSYLNYNNLADGTRYLVNELFGEYGLVIVDGDDEKLKKQVIPIIKKDILDKGFFESIKECGTQLAKNYKEQAFVREINFFRLSAGKRKLIKGKIREDEIEDNPQGFSPNVLLRALFQESVLPNIAYIGGGAEVAYWMQLKTVFKQESIPMPILILRNSALLIDQKQSERFNDLGFNIEELFLSIDELYKKYVLIKSNSKISLEEDKRKIDSLYKKIVSKTSDVGLQRSIKAQLQKQLSSIDSFQEKLIRIEKKNSETAINRIKKIKNQLFPNNILQERYNNFIPFYLKDGDNFIKILKDNLNPLNPNFVVLILEN